MSNTFAGNSERKEWLQQIVARTHDYFFKI